MKEKLQHLRLQDLLRHRNYLTFTCAGLLASNLLMTFALCTQSERVVLVPPHLTGPAWVDRSQVSPQYLEEMALFFGSILLNKTPQSAPYLHELLLRYADASGIGKLKHQLREEEERYQKSGLSTSFYPKKITVVEKNLKVDLSGEIVGYVSQKCIFQREETYRLTFSFAHGRLLIKSFEHLTEKEQGHA
ncbi:MAG: type IV conjugative transfer system protein TraE [Caedibacter sp. 38-128]|nr:type IV conjugative transfer system protein TraE [Holosporales bacterium]OJX06292.1 MAG: type IV conjugative transfer system protein TraE [Caedibacter sp. 38-128]